MNLTKIKRKTEFSANKALFNHQGDIIDIADLTGRTPLDDLMDKEEIAGNEWKLDHKEAQVDSISALLSYLLKDKDPVAICTRIFLLGYVIRPELINGMTLQEIAKVLGRSKNSINQKLKQQDELIQYKGANRKTDEQIAQYRKSAKTGWKKRRKDTEDK